MLTLSTRRFPRCFNCLRVVLGKKEISTPEIMIYYARSNHSYMYKSKGKKRINRVPYGDQDVEEDEEDDNSDDDDDDDFIKGQGIETKTYSMPSLRVDLLLKTAFNTPRKKIEELFYSKKIWINGTLLMKKGTSACVGDEIDISVEVSKENNNFITVKRIEILKVTQDENSDRFLVKLRKTKSMLIENYKDNKFFQEEET